LVALLVQSESAKAA